MNKFSYQWNASNNDLYAKVKDQNLGKVCKEMWVKNSSGKKWEKPCK